MATYCLKKRLEFEAVQYNDESDIKAIKELSGLDKISLKGSDLRLIDGNITEHYLNTSDWLVKQINDNDAFVCADDDFKRDFQGVRAKKNVEAQ